MPDELKTLDSAETFFFSTPLYEKVGLTIDVAKKLYGHGGKVDGYCPKCSRNVTFTVNSTLGTDRMTYIAARRTLDDVDLQCDREEEHRIYFHWSIDKGTIEKYGQRPSLADLTQAELAQYRSLMSKQDAHEFYKAVGLAAHGVGIGSFVYLRRVFERLIQARFEAFKVSENWTDEEFRGLRMAEKVKFLRDHLPQFLVDNAKVYGILSIGIHNLGEDECLGFFQLMRDSIVVILEDDKKKREELELRLRLQKAIVGIDLSKTDTE